MNPQGGLQLRDIHVAADPSWWPPAPGWWLLAMVLILMLMAGWRASRNWRARRRLRRAALSELDGVHAQWAANQQAGMLLAAVSVLLRRVARAHAPHVVALSGEEWLSWLDQLSSSDAFTHGDGRILASGPFQAAPEFDPDALLRCVRTALSRGLR